MSYLSIALAGVGLGTGIWAAYRWFKASKVRLPTTLTVPEIDLPRGMHGPHLAVNALIETHTALVRASKLNSEAAIWTAFSALLNAFAAIAGTLA
jgi:hypothetical protein